MLLELIEGLRNGDKSLDFHFKLAIGDADRDAAAIIAWMNAHMGDKTVGQQLDALDCARFWLIAVASEEKARTHGEYILPTVCEWSLDDDDWSLWEGTCGAAWTLEEGSPDDNNMRFCPECGRPLVTVIPDEEE